MISKEKETVVNIISMAVILAIYSLYVYQNYLLKNPELINNFKFWGIAFLVLIPVSIVAQIIIHIVFGIFNKIVTNEDMHTGMNDERDKLIELKSIRIAHAVFTGGFLLAMGTQAAAMQPWVMFVTLIASGFTATLASGCAKIYFYRSGF